MATKSAKKTVEVKSIAELNKELEAKIADLLQARRGNALGELVNPRVITVTKKEIARIHTAISLTQRDAAKESK
jgi:large subunit ribosomal protein L29